MKTTLIIVEGAKPARIPLKLPTVIGRGDRAKLKLPASLVSRTHCEITEESGRLFVRDLGSSNGTYVNDSRVQQRTELRTDDFLRIGQVTFRVLFDRPAECQPSITPDLSVSSPPTVDTQPGDTVTDPCVAQTTEPATGLADEHAIDTLSEPESGAPISAIVHVEESEDGSVVKIDDMEGFFQSLNDGKAEDRVGESVLQQLDQHDVQPIDADDPALHTFLQGFKERGTR